MPVEGGYEILECASKTVHVPAFELHTSHAWFRHKDLLDDDAVT